MGQVLNEDMFSFERTFHVVQDMGCQTLLLDIFLKKWAAFAACPTLVVFAGHPNGAS